VFRIIPQLTISDMQRSLRFYVDILGFEITASDPEENPHFVTIEKEDSSFFLVTDESREEGKKIALDQNDRGVGIRLYFEVDDASDLHARLSHAGVSGLGDLVYNTLEEYSEFNLIDPDGYELGFYS
jgi:catechol 2,3-dioxygenase-like lactoylglutathione lyase family enzyme